MLNLLGRHEEAQHLLDELSERSLKLANKQLTASLNLESARAALTQRNFNSAKAQLRTALALANDATELKESVLEAKRTLCQANALSGEAREAVPLCKEAVTLGEQTKDPWLLSRAKLTLAEALLENGEAKIALENALALADSF